MEPFDDPAALPPDKADGPMPADDRSSIEGCSIIVIGILFAMWTAR
jgi:hypothetical protein